MEVGLVIVFILKVLDFFSIIFIRVIDGLNIGLIEKRFSNKNIKYIIIYIIECILFKIYLLFVLICVDIFYVSIENFILNFEV